MDGVEMPRLGIGTWPITDRDECVHMVQTALDAGYRHVDTAQLYDNHAHVGEAIETSTVPREEVFVATKLVKGNLSYDSVIESTRESLERLGLDTLDHDLYAHQAEMHPFRHQRELRAYAREHGHRFVAHTPLARGKVFDSPLLSEIADEYGISEVELTIAWLLSKETVSSIPKSTDPDHLRENFVAQTLAIDDADLERIDSLHEWPPAASQQFGQPGVGVASQR